MVSESEQEAILGVRTTLSLITLIASTFLIGGILLFQKYRFPGARLVLYLGITNWIGSIFYLLPTRDDDGPLCDAQAWGITFNDWSTALWISIIAFNLWQTVIRKENSSVSKWGWVYMIIGWGFPLLMSTLPFAGGVYEPTGGVKQTKQNKNKTFYSLRNQHKWCWFTIDSLGWRLSWYVPLFLFFFVISAMYVWIVYTLWAQHQSDVYRREDQADLRKRWKAGFRLSKYPLIFILFWIPAIIHRLQNWITSEEEVFGLIILQVIFGTLQGTANALVYCWDEEIFHHCTPSGVSGAIKKFSTKSSSEVQSYDLDFEEEEKDETESQQTPVRDSEDFEEIKLEESVQENNEE